MATLSDPRDNSLVINDADPVRRTPPLLVVGPLAWIRNNLFLSWFDALLTVGTSALLVVLVTSFVNWVIKDGEWFIITVNLRLFFLGRFDFTAEWRIQFMVLLVAAVLGFVLATWSRVSRTLVIVLVVLIALTFIIPLVSQALLPLPPAYLTAGNIDIVSGSATEPPLANVGFIARAGETVTVQLADTFARDDTALASLSSFTDIPANLLLNNASNRLANQTRIADLDSQLASDLLTANQRQLLTAEKDKLTVPPPVTETYALNQVAVSVRVLNGATLQPIAETVLEPGSTTVLTAKLPEDGWYMLATQVSGSGKGNALLRTTGIYPLMERNFLRSADDTGQGSGAQRVSQYTRLTDGFVTDALRPQIEEKNVPMTGIIDYKFRGSRPLGDYLRVYLSPFLAQIRLGFLLTILATAIGYNLSRWARRSPAIPTHRIAVWLLFATPVLMLFLSYGLNPLLPVTDARDWGGLHLTVLIAVVAIIVSFPIGVLLALGRRSSLPVVKIFCTLYIEFVRGVPFITVLFMAQLLVPLVNPALAGIPGVFRAMVGAIMFSAAYLAENVRGGLQSVSPGQEEAAKAIGLANWQISLYITLPQALRAVIPALVGQFISLFIDTSLVAIVGLIDLTGVGNNVVAQTEFLGERREAYIFITIIYFTFSIVMATISRRIERSGVGIAHQL